MSSDKNGLRWRSIEELGFGEDVERELVDSMRKKILGFERERLAYINAMKSLVESSHSAPSKHVVHSKDRGNESPFSEDIDVTGVAVKEDGPEARAVGSSRLEELRKARRVYHIQAEQIRRLYEAKGDASIRLQGERLSNLEQDYDLGLLRLERLLDRERILELLRLTDPNRPKSVTASRSHRGSARAHGKEKQARPVANRAPWGRGGSRVSAGARARSADRVRWARGEGTWASQWGSDPSCRRGFGSWAGGREESQGQGFGQGKVWAEDDQDGEKAEED
ncbi:unnamed protein product, partial [Choristocarpus tenellus]